jgi:tetrahydromethanopterin S-methyltransferase subunit G
MTKLLYKYKNENNKIVDVVMDPRELSHMEFIKGNRTLYKVYDAEDEFNKVSKRLAKLCKQ